MTSWETEMMGGDQVYIEIVIFAMIAVFLVYRLKNVLGRRTGEERQRPNPFGPPASAEAGVDAGVIRLPSRTSSSGIYQPGDQRPLAAWLEAIEEADPRFNEKSFLAGARAAFAMIVEAYAKGDRATLRPLLSDGVYANFEASIRQREAAGERQETDIVDFRDVDIVDARLDGGKASVTVNFVTLQHTVITGANAPAPATEPEEVTDIWTFTRDTRSSDPNWTLVETRTP